MQGYDPSRIWLYHERLSAIPEEMGAVLECSACSPNIKERRDYSCALFDAQGRLVAQAAHIPVHLGAMPSLMAYLLPRFEWRPGDMVLTNDPYHAGTHLPDWTLVAPVFVGETLVGFVANRAHHADTGGATPGSMPLASEVYEEGLRIPPVKLVEGGVLNETLLTMILHNVRTPEERQGDLLAQMGANQIGIRRLQELMHSEGITTWQERFESLMRYSEQLTRAALAQIPSGEYEFVDYLEDDGRGTRDIPIRVRVIAPASEPGTVRFDFTGSAPQVGGGLNAPEAVTRAACYYVVRCLLPEEVPTNDGCWRPVEVIAPVGTVVNAQPPAAVAGGNVETSQRIVDVLLGALAQALPDRIPAASQGTMNNLLMGGYDPFRQQPFVYYETLAGGAGAHPEADGASGIHTHMTNTRNTPVEALESAYPLRVLEYRLADRTGGAGRYRGGNGIIRTYQFLTETTLTLLTERRRRAPYGLAGGKPGKRGQNLLRVEGEVDVEVSKGVIRVPAGAILTIRTPGGGGWGSPNHAPHAGRNL
ncbi:MAG: hydantoinase B/oxoprolinase family protein [Armatimonadota bacterium]|nr:hydantoinase B/oxoprolinase family protein [Armatimonadota bacterium]